MKEAITLQAIQADNTALVSYDYAATIESFLLSLDLKPRTIESYRKGLKYFFAWVQDEGITHPTRNDIKRYKNYLLDSYKVSTVASYLAAVRCFFRALAQETGKPGLNIADGIHAPKQTKSHKKDALTLDQALHVLEVMPRDTLANKRDYAIVSLMLHNGLRTIEITRLNIEDIRKDTSGIYIDIWGKGRDSKDQTLPLSANAFKAVSAYLKKRGEYKPTDPLFIGVSNHGKGQRMAVRSVSRICKESLKAAGYDNSRITAHSLRHTAVTLAIQGGASLHEAQLLARHSNPATTEIYIHDIERLQNSAVSKLDSLLAS